MSFEMQPITVFCQTAMNTGMQMLQLVCFLRFGYENEVFVAKKEILGIKHKSLSYLHFLFTLVVWT